MSARHELDMALIAMAADGDRPVCAWGDRRHWWTSDDPEDRARAARRCAGCPVYSECAAVAEEEQPCHGVWAGTDWSRRPLTKPKKETA